jgi:hypothetical protein
MFAPSYRELSSQLSAGVTASCLDVLSGTRHHPLEPGAGIDLIEKGLQVGIKANGFAYYEATVSGPSRRKVIEQSIGLDIQYELTSQCSAPRL